MMNKPEEPALDEDNSPDKKSQRLYQILAGKLAEKSDKYALIDWEPLFDYFFAFYNAYQKAPVSVKGKNFSYFANRHEQAIRELNRLRITKDDFTPVKVIGKGNFGEVIVVRDKYDNSVYAMKVLHKASTLSQDNIAFFYEEKDIMARAASQWVTMLHYSFHDEQNLYLVMEFMTGGDLLQLVNGNYEDSMMSEQDASFYLSEIIIAINAIHKIGYVHRDIKPENVLIDMTGHLKLADFGSAAKLLNGQVYGKMPVGTPEYIAPEVLTSMDSGGGRYGKECDYWSVGVMAYEIICGMLPFEGDNVLKLYSSIMNHKETLEFPDDMTLSDECTDLITGLICDQNDRFTYNQLSKHKFFNTLDWTSIRNMCPPHVPKVKSNDDTSNFDEFAKTNKINVNSILNAPKPAGSTTDPASVLNNYIPFVGFTFTRKLNNLLLNESFGDDEKKEGEDERSTSANRSISRMISTRRSAMPVNTLDPNSSMNVVFADDGVLKKEIEDLKNLLNKEKETVKDLNDVKKNLVLKEDEVSLYKIKVETLFKLFVEFFENLTKSVLENDDGVNEFKNNNITIDNFEKNLNKFLHDSSEKFYAKMKELKNERNVLTKNINSLEEKIRHKDEEISQKMDSFLVDKQKIEDELTNLKQTNQTLNEQITIYNSNKKQGESRKNLELAVLNKSLAIEREKNDKITQQLEATNLKVDQLTSTISTNKQRSMEEQDELTKKIDFYEGEVNDLNRQMTAFVKRMSTMMDDTESEKAVALAKFEAMSKERNDLSDKINKQENDMKNYIATISAQKESNYLLNDQLEEMTAINKQLEERFEAMNTELDSLRNQLYEKTIKYTNIIGQQNKLIEFLQDNTSKNKGKRKKMNNMVKGSQAKINHSNTQMSTSPVNNTMATIKEFRDGGSNSSIMARIDTSAQVSELHEKIKTLEAQLETERANNLDLNERHNKVLEELNNLKKETVLKEYADKDNKQYRVAKKKETYDLTTSTLESHHITTDTSSVRSLASTTNSNANIAQNNNNNNTNHKKTYTNAANSGWCSVCLTPINSSESIIRCVKCGLETHANCSMATITCDEKHGIKFARVPLMSEIDEYIDSTSLNVVKGGGGGDGRKFLVAGYVWVIPRGNSKRSKPEWQVRWMVVERNKIIFYNSNPEELPVSATKEEVLENQLEEYLVDDFNRREFKAMPTVCGSDVIAFGPPTSIPYTFGILLPMAYHGTLKKVKQLKPMLYFKGSSYAEKLYWVAFFTDYFGGGRKPADDTSITTANSSLQKLSNANSVVKNRSGSKKTPKAIFTHTVRCSNIKVNSALALTDDLYMLASNEGLYVVSLEMSLIAQIELKTSKPPVHSIIHSFNKDTFYAIAYDNRALSKLELKSVNDIVKALNTTSNDKAALMAKFGLGGAKSTYPLLPPTICKFTDVEEARHSKNISLIACNKLDGEKLFAMVNDGNCVTIFKVAKDSKLTSISEFSMTHNITTLVIMSNVMLFSTYKYYATNLEVMMTEDGSKYIDFLDTKDRSLAFALFNSTESVNYPMRCFPLHAKKNTASEFLLCYSEFGLIVDHDGKRVKEGDLLWEEMPLDFAMSSKMYLYVTHCDSLAAYDLSAFNDSNFNLANVPRKKKASGNTRILHNSVEDSFVLTSVGGGGHNWTECELVQEGVF